MTLDLLQMSHADMAAADVKRLPVEENFAAGGENNALSINIAGKHVRILALSLSSDAAGLTTIKVGAANTVKAGCRTAGTVDWTLPFNPAGWVQTDAKGDDVKISHAVAGNVSGVITYAETDA